MAFGFKARVDDPTVASYRYRVLAPIEALRARGHTVETFDLSRLPSYEGVLFSKAFRSEDQELARQLRAAGKRVLFDLCDDLFYNPQDIPKYRQVRKDLLKMLALCDRVVCSTPTLARAVQQAAGLPDLPAIAPDAYEQASVSGRPSTPSSSVAQLLWFGRHGSPNAPAGMEDVLLIRKALAEAAMRRPVQLTICSDNRAKFDDLFTGFSVPVRYVDWTPRSFASELADTDAVVIPLSRNPFVEAKTHNRLTLALSAGVPVVADSIESYREFDRFCYLDDWAAGLGAVLLRPDEARARARGARSYLEMHWSMTAVVTQWERALGLPDAGATLRPAISVRTGRVPEAISWLRSDGRAERSWLIAGDGADPTLVSKARTEGFLVLSIGSAFNRFPVDASLVVDVETMREHGTSLEIHGGCVIAPAFPHVDGWATKRPLSAWAEQLPRLQALLAQGRLMSFDLWTGSTEGLTGDFGGEEIPLRLLVAAGVHMARHLGARNRGVARPGFEATGPLSERVTGGVAALRNATHISYGPYGFPIPAQIFVGSDDEQQMGVRLLEYSIQKHSTMDVQVEVLDFRRIPVPKDPKNRSRTGFSFCRFDIPRLCGYKGRGVYVDADMQVFADITDLWTLPLDEADVLYALSHPAQGRTPQTSVMLLNCEVLKWDVKEIIGGLDEGRYGYKDLMQNMCIHPAERVKPLLPYWWNSLERYEPGRTSLIHYTDMPTQPWVSHANKNGELWYRAFAEALDTGFINESEVADAIEKGHVSPRLPHWIGGDRSAVDENAAAVWVAPYNRFTRSLAEVEGSVSLISDRRLAGWAFRPTAPEERVSLGLYDGADLLLTFQADTYADILERHGKGDGRHAFEVAIPSEIWRSNCTALSVRVVEPELELQGSPIELVR
jgi:hypothetical protein